MEKSHSTLEASKSRERNARNIEKNVSTLVEQAVSTKPVEDTRPLLLLAQGEGRFGRISRPRSCWAPPGRRPEVPAQIVREAIYAFTAVAPALGKICSLLFPSANTESMNVFLQHVSQTFSDSFLVMQVDQAGWHRAKELVIPENMRLIQQPPYSPELNPVEHIWDDIRETYFHNRVFASLDSLTEKLCGALNDLENDPKRITSLTFFPHLRAVL
jgi:putative transposase